jgi:hypothetical protein
MKSLEEMSLAQRIVTTFIIVLIVLLLLSLIGWTIGGWDESPAEPASLVLILPPSKWDGKIIELDEQALDEAYIQKIKHLFDIWVRDYESAHPERAMKGAAQARRAYVQIRDAIEIRRQQLETREQK